MARRGTSAMSGGTRSGRGGFGKSSVGVAGPKTVKLRTVVGRAVPATNGGSGRPSTSMGTWNTGSSRSGYKNSNK